MQRFNTIVSRIFSIPEDSVRDDMSSKDIPDWDSMNYLMLISELEKEFGLSFTMDEVMSAQTVGDLKHIVEVRATKNGI